MTLTMKAKRTAMARTSGPHRTRATRRSLHGRAGAVHPSRASQRGRTAGRGAIHDYVITVDGALLTEARDWTVFAGVSLAGWLTAAIVFGIV
jgi:hypothetical protein